MRLYGGRMILQQCKKNHFYNADKFKKCPYCALEKSGIEEDTDVFLVDSIEETENVMDAVKNIK